MSDARNELEQFIALEVEAGFHSRETIIADAIDYMLDEYSPEWLEEQAAQITDRLLQTHDAKQRTWTQSTDCDRLDEAFAELDRMGIVARQNFACCQTCGHLEMNLELDETQRKRPIRGYVFYHRQDTDAAVQYGYLYLAYGAPDGKEEASRTIAFEVLDVLTKHGIKCEWNGDVRTRICIPTLDWKRRRVPFRLMQQVALP